MTAARATVGDAVRRSERELRAARSISPLAGAIGVSREFLYRVLSGDEWTWPSGPRTRPPGSRLPDTPVTTLAAYTVDNHQFALVSYTDTAGSKCVAVDQDGERGPAVRDVEVSAKDLVNAGMTMASKTTGQGLAAVYGRAHDSVTGLYAVMRALPWPARAAHAGPPEAGTHYRNGSNGHCGQGPRGAVSLARRRPAHSHVNAVVALAAIFWLGDGARIRLGTERTDLDGQPARAGSRTMAQQVPPDTESRARSVFGDLIEGRWEKACREFDPGVRHVNADQIARAWTNVTHPGGSFQGMGALSARQSGGYTVVGVSLTFQTGDGASAPPPARNQGPGRSLPGPYAAHPLQGADSHPSESREEYTRAGRIEAGR